MSLINLLPSNGNLSDIQKLIGQEFMNATVEHHNREIDDLKKTYPDLDERQLMDISYLRTRSRHTPELEKRLVERHRNGFVVMICDWPDHEDNNYDPFTGKPLNDGEIMNEKL